MYQKRLRLQSKAKQSIVAFDRPRVPDASLSGMDPSIINCSLGWYHGGPGPATARTMSIVEGQRIDPAQVRRAMKPAARDGDVSRNQPRIHLSLSQLAKPPHAEMRISNG